MTAVPGEPQPKAGHTPIERFARARCGDRAALEELIRGEWPRVNGILAAETGSRTEAEDLTQEAFARVLPRLGSLSGPGSFSAYVDQVARNLARDRRRRRRVRTVEPVPRPLEDAPSEWPGPEATMLGRLDARAVREALCCLSDEHRRVLDLRLQQGRSARETALLMHRSPEAVRQLQHRALLSLRAAFLAREDGGSPAVGPTAGRVR